MNGRKFCLILLMWISLSAAQDLRTLRGEVRADVRTDLSWLTVRLDAAGAPTQGDHVAVSSGGDFTYPNVAEGAYTLRLFDPFGEEILSQPVMVRSVNPPILLQLPRFAADRPTGQTASIAQLRHRPSRQALAAARKAQGFSEAGDFQRSAVEWRKAVEADPEFSDAHGNLGAQYVRLHRPADAVEEFTRAIALDPHTARHQSNLAVALSQLGRFEEAESWARRAVRMEESSPLGHYVLGCVLTVHTNTVDEAIHELQIAARQFAGAHAVLARVYDAEGKKGLAAAERSLVREETQHRAIP